MRALHMHLMNVVVTLLGNGTPRMVVSGVLGLWSDLRAEASDLMMCLARKVRHWWAHWWGVMVFTLVSVVGGL
jgi:hypothetical protein